MNCAYYHSHEDQHTPDDTCYHANVVLDDLTEAVSGGLSKERLARVARTA